MVRLNPTYSCIIFILKSLYSFWNSRDSVDWMRFMVLLLSTPGGRRFHLLTHTQVIQHVMTVIVDTLKLIAYIRVVNKTFIGFIKRLTSWWRSVWGAWEREFGRLSGRRAVRCVCTITTQISPVLCKIYFGPKADLQKYNVQMKFGKLSPQHIEAAQWRRSCCIHTHKRSAYCSTSLCH